MARFLALPLRLRIDLPHKTTFFVGPPGKRIRNSGLRKQQRRMNPNEILQAVFEEAPAYLTVYEGPELRITMVNRVVRERFADRLNLGQTLRDVVPANASILAAVERVY